MVRATLLLSFAAASWCAVGAGAPAAMPASTAAASPALLHHDPPFRSLGLADGLPSSEVAKITQDHDGYLWFGTHDGLVRHDGVGVRTWRHDASDPASLGADDVAIVFVDHANRIWCGGDNAGLSVLGADRQGFRRFAHDAADPASLAAQDVWAIAEDHDAGLWVGGSSTGLEHLEKDGHTFTHFRHDAALPDSLGADRVFALFVDTRGAVWAGHTRGVDRLARDAHGDITFQHVDFTAVPGEERLNAYSLMADGEGAVMATTRRGLVRIGDDLRAHLVAGAGLGDLRTLGLARSGDGAWWVGTLHGLNRVGRDGHVDTFLSNPLKPGSLPADDVLDAFADRQGGLWFATQGGGIGHLPAQWRDFALYRALPGDAQSLSSDRVQQVSVAPDGALWAVNEEGGLDRIDAATGSVQRLGERWGVPDPLLEGVLVTRDQRVWVGHVRGLRIYDAHTGRHRDIGASGDDGAALLPGKIDILREARDGAVWVRSWGSGVDRIDAHTLAVTRFDGPAAGLRGADVSAIELDPGGRVLVASGAGIDVFDPATSRFVPLAGVALQHVLAFAFASDGSLWVHASGELDHFVYRDATAQLRERVDTTQRWPALSAGGLAVDAQGRVWASSARGLWRYDPRTHAVRAFDAYDGLASAEFASTPMARRADGVLFAATRGGVVGFLPDAIDGVPAVAPLVLDAAWVRRAGRDLSLDARAPRIDLRWDDHDLRLSARLLAFGNPAASRYQWQVGGVDTDWVDTGSRGEREIAQLPAGTHELRVRAALAGADFVELPPLRLVQATPPWRAPWALAGYAILAVTAVLLGSRGYRRRIDARHAIALVEQQRRFAEQASAAKSQFLATMGHEIRTPMTGVLGMAELLLRTSLDATQRGFAEAIESSGQVMLRLINDSLDLARIEAGKLELDEAPFDLRALIADLDALSAPLAARKGLRWRCHVDADAPRRVVGDVVRVRQVLGNLINNALKFTVQGEVGLCVARDHAGATRVEVHDTGPGITPELRARLFGRFEQARHTQRFGGSGLGLAICRELVGCMGGAVDVDSVAGAGSRFRVLLPLPAVADATVAEPMPQGKAREGARAPLQGRVVLLVEDDAVVAAVVQGQLEAAGARVLHAAHGLAALALADAAPPDVALIDLDLPGLDGLSLARAWRRREAQRPRALPMPMIGLSARSVGDEEALCLAAGMQAFLRKPVIGAVLVARVAAACDGTAA